MQTLSSQLHGMASQSLLIEESDTGTHCLAHIGDTCSRTLPQEPMTPLLLNVHAYKASILWTIPRLLPCNEFAFSQSILWRAAARRASLRLS